MLRVATVVAAVLVAGATLAQDSGLQRLDRHDEVRNWAAVGRLDMGRGGFCTGALIAPDIVLTAAHCIVRKSDGKPMDPAGFVFRAGYRDGTSTATRRVKHSVAHPDYDYFDRDGVRRIQTDVALLRLESAIPTNIASPFRVADRAVGDKVSVVSYARERSEALSWQRECGVRDSDKRIASFSCDVHFGSSGAPVFDMSRRSPQIVSIISSGNRSRGQVTSWGPQIVGPIAQLKEALRTSNGVTSAGGGRVSVIQQSNGARFVRAGDRSKGGARFVKP